MSLRHRSVLALRPLYLVVLKEGGAGAFTTDELLAGDFSSAETGLSDIIRLSDLARWEDAAWVPMPQGIARTPDLGEDGFGEPEHFHPSYLDAPPHDGGTLS